MCSLIFHLKKYDHSSYAAHRNHYYVKFGSSRTGSQKDQRAFFIRKEFYRYVLWAQTYQDLEMEKMYASLQEKKLQLA